MRSKGQPSLPSGRAFVVQLHAEADVAQGHFKGRVEHIVSYQATHFDSLAALASFMARVVAAHEAQEEEDEPGLRSEAARSSVGQFGNEADTHRFSVACCGQSLTWMASPQKESAD